MAKELVVSATTHETRVATLEDDRLVEISIERASEHALAGNIYKGRVSRVLPGMQSAFVKIGLERDAFLYVSDVLDKTEEIEAGSLDEEEDAVVTSASRDAGAESEDDSDADSDDGRRRGRGRRGRRRGRGRGRDAEEDRKRPEAEPELDHSRSARPDAEERTDDEEEPGYRRRRRGRRRGRRSREEERPESEEREPRERKSEEDRDGSPLSVLPGESLAKYRGQDEEDDDYDSEEDEVVYEEVEEGDDSDAEEDEEYEYEYVYEEEEVDDDEGDLAQEAAGETADGDAPGSPEDEESEDQDAADEPDEDDEPDEESDSDDEEDSDDDEEDDSDEEEDDSDHDEEDDDSDDDSDDEDDDEEEEDSDDDDEDVSADEAEEGSDEDSDEDRHGAPGMPEPEGDEDSDEEESSDESRAAAGAEVRDRSESRGLRRGRRGRRRGGRGRRGRSEDGDEAEETSRVEAAEDDGGSNREPRSERGGRGRRTRGGRADSGRASNDGGEPATLISDLLKPGQEVIVQIAKEPLGKKGARITSHIALPGRYLVYMPTVKHVGVSRKIHSDAERARLRRVIRDNMDGAPGGCIIRTAGQGATDDDLIADLKFLINIWKTVLEKAERRQAPTMLHQDLDVVERILRDQLGQSFKTIWVDSEDQYERVLQFVERFQPDLVSRVKLYTKAKPIFDEFGISTEIEKALRPKVWLKSGGYLVINQTEALVAIDINTGKYVGKSDRLEDTIVKTNLEAVQEIVRQMRLRDLGGIIVVDFIDMDDRQNRKKVMQALEKELRTDRAPSKALQFNDFGLVAITRKRVKQSLERTLCSPCPSCTGSGYVKSVPTMIFEILEDARKAAAGRKTNKDVTLRVHPDIARTLKSRDNSYLQELEETFGSNVIVRGDLSLHRENFDIIS